MGTDEICRRIAKSVDEAKNEAFKRGVEANTIMTSETLAASKPFCMRFTSSNGISGPISRVPQFFMGLHVLPKTIKAECMPNEADFMIFKGEETPTYEDLKKENETLKAKLEKYESDFMTLKGVLEMEETK